MRNFFLLGFLVFILGLFLAFRLSTVGTQNARLREFGPIDLEITLKESPKFSSQFQVIENGEFTVFADIYPRFAIGDVLKISGEANSEGLIFRPKIEKTGREKSALSYLADLREEISKRIDQLMPSKEATLVKGMVLGVDEIDKSFREQLISTGTIHAVVVSGQNLSIVAGFFMVLVKYLGRRLSMFLSILAVLFYAALTGFEVPVVRALIMVILSYGAVFLGRERMVIWNLLLAAVIILLIWPAAIFDVSFQLTFAATLGIMTLGRGMSDYALGHSFSRDQMSLRSTKGPPPKADGVIARSRAPSRILSNKVGFILLSLFVPNAAVATSAYLFTASLIFFHFGRVSFISPFVNVLVAEAIVPIMVLGLIVAAASLVFMPLAQVLAYFALVPAYYFVKIVQIFGR